VTETWKDLLQEIEEAIPDWGNTPKVFVLRKKVLDYIEKLPVDEVKNWAEDLLRPIMNHDSRDEEIQIYILILSYIIYNLPLEHRFVMVRLCMRYLAEEIKTDSVKWCTLWAFFAANKTAIKNAPQVRQLRSLAKKLVATNLFYKNHTLIIDQLIFIPEKMRMSKLERFAWFREKNPKWLNS
jgi:hypothetical protein